MELEQNLLALYGERGQKWLSDLPHFLRRIETQLGIQLGKPYSNLTYHYVAPAKGQDGEAYVLKWGVPDQDAQAEVSALHAYAGEGCVQLINHDLEEGWLLLEACQPGVPLSTLKDDEKATHELLQVMQKLWRPVPKDVSLPSVEDLLDGLVRMQKNPRAQSLFSKTLLEFVCGAAQELQASMGEPQLLHGDLHHDNVLSSMREPYLAIDPKGLIGECEYEFGAMMRNSITRLKVEVDLPRFLKRRLDQIAAETNFDQERVLLWSLVQAVLAVYWQIEDGEQPESVWVRAVEAFYGLC